MRWFSDRCSRAPRDHSWQNHMQAAVNMHCSRPVTPGGHTMESSALACSIQPTAHVSPYHALSMGMTQQFFIFLSLWPWPITPKFELGWDFCTVHLTAKFHHLTFNHSEVIAWSNKRTDWQTVAGEKIHLVPLCYAGGLNLLYVVQFPLEPVN